MGWLGERLGQFKTPAVAERRNLGERRDDLRRIDFGNNHARLGAGFRENAAPRIDHERMAERFSPAFMAAALRRGENETTVFDGTRAKEHMPMRLAGLSGKGRRD